MKHYFTSAELPHIWANLTPEEIKSHRTGKCPTSETFRGADYFSYWAVIGRHVVGKGGQRGVIVSRKGYSNTTTRHQSGVRSAVKHLPHFTVDTWANITGPEVFTNLKERAMAMTKLAVPGATPRTIWNRRKPSSPKRSRRASSSGCASSRSRRTLIRRWRMRKPSPLRKRSPRNARPNGCALRWRSSELWRTHRDGEHPEWVALRAEAQKEGMTGMPLRERTDDGFNADAILRLSVDRTRVETSQRAQVLVRSVAFLWPLVANARATHEAVASDVIARLPRLDNYSVSAIDAHGNLTAGCHNIAYSEIERIAGDIGLPVASEAAVQAQLLTPTTSDSK